MIKICSGCDRSITSEQDYDTYPVDTGGATGGADVYYHHECQLPKPATGLYDLSPVGRRPPGRRPRPLS